MITQDKIAGAYYGVALGDALGRETEFLKLPAIYRAFGRTGIMRLPKSGKFTDDTQMTIAVARALRDARSITPKELARTFKTRFIEWAAQDEPRAPGMSCMTAIRNLRRRGWRGRWTNATTLSKGCGANMRVVPTALLPNGADAVGASLLQAAITHGHPDALVATELTALAVRWAAEGLDVAQLPQGLLMICHSRATQDHLYRGRWLGRLWTRWDAPANHELLGAYARMGHRLTRLMNVLAENCEMWDVCAILGQGWVADEALITSLYHAVRYADNPTLAISMAARTSGDSDSLASITGAILGAARGEGVWPAEWRQRIERRADIEVAINISWSLYVAGTDDQV